MLVHHRFNNRADDGGINQTSRFAFCFNDRADGGGINQTKATGDFIPMYKGM